MSFIHLSASQNDLINKYVEKKVTEKRGNYSERIAYKKQLTMSIWMFINTYFGAYNPSRHQFMVKKFMEYLQNKCE